ncbi:hypothetical protein ACFQ2M_00350 [Kitasatospora saccharophila]|uniref:hypothetical protein n=1 Tax=Kitasatospora saccharophila TaxID=407973 RepID=UPI0036308756
MAKMLPMRWWTALSVMTGRAAMAAPSSPRPSGPAPRVRAGCAGRPFVATVVLQLSAEGRISPDDPVERRGPVRRAQGGTGRRRAGAPGHAASYW